ncbi:MAG: hypothetical protein ABUS54_11235 [Actinomycetota bacterium]
MEPLNAIDLAVIQRALAQAEMERWTEQVVTICHKLGLAVPEWATPRPAAPEPQAGS